MDIAKNCDHNSAIIKFGTYTYDYSIGSEPIEWYIIKSCGGCVKLLSKYILDLQPFDSWDEGYVWQRTRLASWLNGQFELINFSETEQDAICAVSDLEDIGLKTQTDKLFINVFLLSQKEICNLPSDIRHTYATKACTSKAINQEQIHWWTRDYDANSHSSLTVDVYGNIDKEPTLSNEYRGVRPVVWIDLMKCLLESNMNLSIVKDYCEPYSKLL